MPLKKKKKKNTKKDDEKNGEESFSYKCRKGRMECE